MNTSIQNNLDNINPESKIIKTENSLDNSKVPSEKEEIKENKENKKEEKNEIKKSENNINNDIHEEDDYNDDMITNTLYYDL